MTSDAKAASLAARLVDSNRASSSRYTSSDDEDDDAIFAALEEEIENDGDYHLREKGLEAMRSELKQLQERRDVGFGRYTEMSDEKEIVRLTARQPRCVVHFYHSNFQRCAIMDKHLSKLAPKYQDTLFLRVFVEHVPWLVERLGIKVLPCLVCFVDGTSKERLIGFEELGNQDGFETATLELRLSMCGVIRKTQVGGSGLNTVYKVSTGRSVGQDEPDFDLDD